MRRASLLVVLLVVVAAYFLAPIVVDGRMNTVSATPLPTVSPEARSLHKSLFVADLHADQLLWGRDLLMQANRGHVDIPRLREGNVALQVFSAVTKTPRGMNYDHNTGETDNILLLALLQRWPVATWRSLRARAVYQAQQLYDAAARSNGSFTVITTQKQFADFVTRRAATPSLVGGILAIEGLHALDGKLESVDTLFAAGFRMMGLTHFFDNEVAASAHGVTHAGITPFGRTVLQRMNALGMIVDLAHASPQTVEEALVLYPGPIVVSHTGVVGTCPGPRNLTDAQLQKIAAHGGVIGIGYWDAATCTIGVDAVVRAMMYAAKIAGADHIALGSDFDGATHEPFDTSHLDVITDGLLKAGMSADDVRKVMGGNVGAFLAASLPLGGK